MTIPNSIVSNNHLMSEDHKMRSDGLEASEFLEYAEWKAGGKLDAFVQTLDGMVNKVGEFNEAPLSP